MGLPLHVDAASEVLRDIEALGQERGWPIVGPVKGRLLQTLAEHCRPRHVVEVGTLVGYSAILVARHIPSGGKLWTLEIDPRAAEMARRNIHRAGLTDRIEIVVGNALDTLPALAGPFDMAFLDATKDEYLAYLKAVEPNLVAGCLVVADNAGMFAKAMAPYLEHVRHSEKYLSRFYDFGFDGVEVSYRLPVFDPFFPAPASVGAAA